MRGTGTAADERQRINLTVIPGLTGDLLIYKAALVLFRPQADRQKTTIYNSGLPQDSRLFYKKPRDLLVEGGPAGAGRRPQCGNRQCKSPPSNVNVLSEGR